MDQKIYDCFIFYNELELLKIRLSELHDKVDHFVICEATVTFQGEKKPLNFANNKDTFEEYLDKIIYVVVDDMPNNDLVFSDPIGKWHPEFFTSNWNREFFQRNAIRRGLLDAAPHDIIIVSDCDEIIRASAIDFLREREGYFMFDMAMYQFFINMRALESGWNLPFAYSFFLSDRVQDYNFHRWRPRAVFEEFAGLNHLVNGGGWHFTFLGGKQGVRTKLQSYAHTDGWQRQLVDERLLEEQFLELNAVGGDKMLEFCRVDQTFPKSIESNLQHYIDIGLVKDEMERLRELELLHRKTATRLRAVKIDYEIAIDDLRELRRETRAIAVRFPNVASALPGGAFNLLRSSCDFAAEWYQGMQSSPPTLAKGEAPKWMAANAVMCHPRDDAATMPDTNVGHYTVKSIRPGEVYTASCWVWLPRDFMGSCVELSIGEWSGQTKTFAQLQQTICWQRITASAVAPPGAVDCHAVLRIHSDVPCLVYSTGWQLEENDTPTNYRATFRNNLLRSSCDFSVEWDRGMQIVKPTLCSTYEISQYEPGNEVMRHPVDGSATTLDSNVGSFKIGLIRPWHIYTVSCWIWLSQDFLGSSVYLSIGEWVNQTQFSGRLQERMCWQRISATGIAPNLATHCSAVLRVTSDFPCEVYSTCWQLEESEKPSTYRATRL